MNESAAGLWKETSKTEIAATIVLSDVLKPFQSPLEECYECGVELLTLPCNKQNADLQILAPYLKRTLNDLRAIWNLLLIGYTSQAGSIAAATFEHALIASSLLGHPDRVNKLTSQKYGDSPWSIKDLCKFQAIQAKEESIILGKVMTDMEFEIYWQRIYAAYKWLCKIKHPTLPSAAHDAGSTSLADGKYVVMALPDIRPNNNPVKYTIIVITVSRLHHLLRNLALRMDLDNKNDRVKRWQNILNKITPETVAAYESSTNHELPFTVYDSNLFALINNLI
ncbi:hypothetical protein [Propionispora vibrioides]|uniref:Uncharacterized protein n=1 Tax=Propionispora vibrioides TaxID=112903 RepID=A0A1H8Y455_9FIRM|nr:hypothetical protein [Propionispora vibrioides]SEP46852.1 hypothetical protein SAMN04490178_14119 [Propionispora vibrioides]